LSWEYLIGLNVRYSGNPIIGDKSVTIIIEITCVDSLFVLAKLSLATQIILNTQKITNKTIRAWIRNAAPCPFNIPYNGDELLTTTQAVSGMIFGKISSKIED
jgi:hypothetical protein